MQDVHCGHEEGIDVDQDAEMDALEAGGFVCVAQVCDLALGRLRRVEVAGRLICLARTEEGIFAVDDDCTHIAAALDQGTLTGCILTCPLHLAQFDVRTGAVLRGPARTPVATYAVRVEDDCIWLATVPTTPQSEQV